MSISLQITGNCSRKIVAGRSSEPVAIFQACSLTLKAGGEYLYCTLIESICIVFEVEFRMDFLVRFVAEPIIANHGSLLKVYNISVKSVYLLNRLR
jgi:hypothetical protein